MTTMSARDDLAKATYPTPPPASERRVLGHPVPRIEDLPLVTGRGRYAGDINFPHQLHMRMVRSPKAHGRIVSVDTSAALALPGVVAVWTNADIAELSPIDFRADKNADRHPRIPPAGAGARPSCAMSAIRWRPCSRRTPIWPRTRPNWSTVEIEELPVVISASDPPGEFEPGRSDRGDHSAPQLRRHRSGVPQRAHGRRARPADRPPLRRAAGDARRHRPLRRRASDILELHGAAKIPHRNRETLCRMLNRSPSSLHVHESHVGGGFGIRGELYPEDVLVLVAAHAASSGR